MVVTGCHNYFHILIPVLNPGQATSMQIWSIIFFISGENFNIYQTSPLWINRVASKYSSTWRVGNGSTHTRVLLDNVSATIFLLEISQACNRGRWRWCKEKGFVDVTQYLVYFFVNYWRQRFSSATTTVGDKVTGTEKSLFYNKKCIQYWKI